MKYLFFLAIGFFTMTGHAQDAGMYTEDEIATQSDFIAATMEKYKGNQQKAIDGFKSCLKKNIANHAAAFELAKIYLQDGNYDEAIFYGKKALDQDANNKWYLVFMANVYMEALEYDKAILILQKLIQIFPKEKFYHEQLGYAQNENGSPLEAIATLDALERIIGIDENTIRRKFELYNALDKFELAEAEMMKLVNYEPTNTRYLSNLASFYMNQGRQEDGLATYQKILTIDPDHARANIEIAGSNKEVKDDASFLSSLSEVVGNKEITLDDKVKTLIPFVTNISSSSDSVEVAALDKVLKTLREAHPKSPKAFALSGDFYSQTLQNSQAIKWYEKTLSLNDNIYNVWEQLMYTLVEVKEFKKLLVRSESAIDLYPNKVSAYILHAKALKELGKNSDAKSILQDARMIAGKNKSYLDQISDLEEGLE